ncbi:Hypothetical predicted protein [Octopus vulgaris]|uniref:Uncharacterized protein n=1 Tax=Octopus vulgaris TaxID=6645 RepID=A0AA36BJZ4_OCTVU|nr:Hypothetical predicted protein [Octopus vulgaris]
MIRILLDIIIKSKTRNSVCNTIISVVPHSTSIQDAKNSHKSSNRDEELTSAQDMKDPYLNICFLLHNTGCGAADFCMEKANKTCDKARESYPEKEGYDVNYCKEERQVFRLLKAIKPFEKCVRGRLTGNIREAATQISDNEAGNQEIVMPRGSNN